MKDSEKKLRGDLVALRQVIGSPEWGIFRSFIESRLRSLWSAACMASTDTEKLRHMAAAEGIVLMLRDFELEEVRLEQWLTFEGLRRDSERAAEVEETMRGVRGQPRPYQEDK